MNKNVHFEVIPHSKPEHKRKTHGEADAFLNAGFC